MKLIVIFIALFLERMLGQISRLRGFDLFKAYVRLIEQLRIGRAWLSRPLGVLVIVPPLALVAVLQWHLAASDRLAPELLFGLFILLVSFGPRDLWEEVHALARVRSRAAHDDVEARARAFARRSNGHDAPDIRPSIVLGAVLVQAHERVLAVMLWFFVAGPAGALFYRLVRELPMLAARNPDAGATARTAEYMHGIAAFVPARLVALVYALCGNSRAAFATWRLRRRHTWRASGADSWRLLATVGRSALGFSPEAADHADVEGFNAMLIAALGLIWRSLLVLLALMALSTVVGITP